MYKISIVVPVYRTEQYLDQCIGSLIAQSYRNLEIILIDDGSPDNCGAICDNYAAQDPRIRVIHKENGGSSSARAAGIAAATGDYLTFVDSDDWIEWDTFAQCVEAIRRDGAECVMYGYVKEYPNASIPVHLFDGDFSYDAVRSEACIHRRLVGLIGEELAHPEKIDQLSSTCTKLYRADIARKGNIVSEREVGTSEDAIFNLYALEQCRISYINQCFYHYRKTNEQSITSSYKPGLAEKWDVMYHYFQEYVDRPDAPDIYRTALLNRIACGMIGLGLYETLSRDSMIKTAGRIRAILSKEYYVLAFRQLDLSHCPLKWKVFFLLCRYKAALSLTMLLTIINYLRSRMSA